MVDRIVGPPSHQSDPEWDYVCFGEISVKIIGLRGKLLRRKPETLFFEVTLFLLVYKKFEELFLDAALLLNDMQ